MMYKLETINVYNVVENASIFIAEQKGKKLTSALSAALGMDTRNDYFAPRKGARHSFTLQNAGGILGGDNYFVKALAETSWYFPMPLNTVLNLRGKLGMIRGYGGKRVPIYEKFFVGGLGTIRGFEYGRAGPIDNNREAIGAEKMAVFNSELIFPLAPEIGLRGAVFWDIGKGFDHWTRIPPLKTGVGVGIRWFSPFGPIQIDLGFNPFPKKGEKGSVIDFTAGTIY
jgi:outer membrane protein insertion porin family